MALPKNEVFKIETQDFNYWERLGKPLAIKDYTNRTGYCIDVKIFRELEVSFVKICFISSNHVKINVSTFFYFIVTVNERNQKQTYLPKNFKSYLIKLSNDNLYFCLSTKSKP